MAGIYKSTVAKERVLNLYEEKLASIEVELESRYVDTYAGKTHVLIAGDTSNPPVVLLHGVNSGVPMALEAVQGLAKEFCIYGIDIIGQPNRSAERRLPLRDASYGRWLEQVLRMLKLEEAPFMAVSYGAFILQRLMAFKPSYISKAIFIVPAGFVNGQLFPSVFKVVMPMRRYMKSKKRSDLEHFMQAFYSDINEYDINYQEAVLKGVNMDVRRPPFIKRKVAKSFQAPVYILASGEDIFFPGDKAIRKAQRLFPNVKTTELIENMKHVPAPKHYPKIEKLLLKWLKE